MNEIYFKLWFDMQKKYLMEILKLIEYYKQMLENCEIDYVIIKDEEEKNERDFEFSC